jgi:uncharacterized protein (DUF488 family)
MSTGSMSTKLKRHIFSIGHSNHPIEKFVSLLKQNEIELVADTRSQPYSRYAPHFSSGSIEALLKKEGIEYLFFGKELGGRPQEPEFYDSEGHVLYWKLANTTKLKEGVQRLEEEAKNKRVAIMCSEEDPTCCHRRLLVGKVLSGRGTDLGHIRSDGRIQSENELVPAGTQNDLFNPSEKVIWRSIQSVLQRGQQQSSSEH